MTFIVSPNIAPVQASAPSAGKAAGGKNKDERDAGSFGATFSRSLAKSEKPAVTESGKSATPERKTAQRKPADEKIEQPDPASAMPLSFIPVDTLPAGLPAGDARSDTASAIAATAQTASGPIAQEAAAVDPQASAPAADIRDATAMAAAIEGVTAAEAEALPARLDAGLRDEQQAMRQAQDSDIGKTGAAGRIDSGATLARPLAFAGVATAGDSAKFDSQAAAPDIGAAIQQSARSDTASAAIAAAADREAPGEVRSGTDTSAMFNPANLPAPAAGVAAQAPPAPASLALAPVVGSSEWGDALGKQMVWLSHANQEVAELHLNPPGMGPLKVTLTISDQQAQAVFVSSHPAVRSAIEAALPHLRTTLAESGINLGNTSVSADSQQGAMAQQQQNPHGQSGRRAGWANAGSIAGLAMNSESPAATATAIRQNGGAVDTFA